MSRIGGLEFLRLQKIQSFGARPRGDRVWANLLATSGRTIRLRIHGHHLDVG